MFFWPSLFVAFLVGCQPTKKITPSNPSQAFNWCTANEELALSEAGQSKLLQINDCYGNKIADEDVNLDTVAWKLIQTGSKEAEVYNGIGRYGNCTGTLLDVGGSSSSPAYILTNGHCIGQLLGAQEVWKDHDTLSKTMTFNYFKDNASTSARIIVEDKIIKYANMHNSDFAIIELNTNYGELIQQGVSSFKFASSPPDYGTMIEIIGVAQSGVSLSNLGLRKSVCQILENVKLHEGVYTFDYAYRTRPCSIVGGNSGSPVLNHKTREIVAILNTTVNDSSEGKANCELDRPCEVADDGTTSENLNVNYAQPIVFLRHCFNSSGVFDSSLSSCTMNPDPNA